MAEPGPHSAIATNPAWAAPSQRRKSPAQCPAAATPVSRRRNAGVSSLRRPSDDTVSSAREPAAAAAAAMSPPPPRPLVNTRTKGKGRSTDATKVSKTPSAGKKGKAAMTSFVAARAKGQGLLKPPRKPSTSRPPSFVDLQAKHADVDNHIPVHADDHVPVHIDTEGHLPAHVEFQAMLDAGELSNNDALNMLDEMSPSVDGYVSFMNDDQHISDGPFEECIEEEDVLDVPTPTSKKKLRGGNYSVLEDEALVLAWENVSLDPVTGKDQPGITYWQRIADYYHTNINRFRTVGSHNHRWSLIAECCTRWSGCVKNIERQQPSGLTMQDRLNATQELYKQREPHGRSFVMLHCWALLQYNEKWINRNIERSPSTKRASSDGCEHDDTTLEEVRPQGKEANEGATEEGWRRCRCI